MSIHPEKTQTGRGKSRPRLPEHHDDSSLEEERVALVDEMKKKKKNMTLIRQKMELTFSLQWKEVVEGQPMVSEVQERWPALFSFEEIRLLTFIWLLTYSLHHLFHCFALCFR